MIIFKHYSQWSLLFVTINKHTISYIENYKLYTTTIYIQKPLSSIGSFMEPFGTQSIWVPRLSPMLSSMVVVTQGWHTVDRKTIRSRSHQSSGTMIRSLEPRKKHTPVLHLQLRFTSLPASRFVGATVESSFKLRVERS